MDNITAKTAAVVLNAHDMLPTLAEVNAVEYAAEMLKDADKAAAASCAAAIRKMKEIIRLATETE